MLAPPTRVIPLTTTRGGGAIYYPKTLLTREIFMGHLKQHLTADLIYNILNNPKLGFHTYASLGRRPKDSLSICPFSASSRFGISDI